MREEINRILAVIIMFGFMLPPTTAGALTTFGKSNQNQNQNPPPQPTPVGKARECKMESDCTPIQNTTCMADPRDGRNRCLCGDYSPPLNGACTNKYKAIRAPCNDDSECVEGAHCIQHNSTMPGKRCYCKEGYYEESSLMCSGCSSVFTLYTTATMLAVSVISGSLGYL